jgi:hypothetical protein
MSYAIRRSARFTDAQAVEAIAQFKQPLRMALASVIWWDCVPHRDMPETEKAMRNELKGRHFPTSVELIDAMVVIGFDSEYAKQRIVDDSVLANKKKKAMRRMRARREKGIR